jgi:hypothetical protein
VNEHDKAAKAAQLVEAMTGFYIHFVAFALVMVVLFLVNLLATPDVWWVQWPLLGWGIGVVVHYIAVFSSMPQFIVNWQLRKIKEVKDRM